MIKYDKNHHLPTVLAKHSSSGRVEYNLSSIFEEFNDNFAPSQKLLIHWFMARIQNFLLIIPFQSEKFKAARIYILTLCETCQYAKIHRQSTKGFVKAINPDTDGVIHANQLRARNLVSADYFDSRIKGHTCNSTGGLITDKYEESHMFVDSMRSYIYVEYQLGLSGSETIRATQKLTNLH